MRSKEWTHKDDLVNVFVQVEHPKRTKTMMAILMPVRCGFIFLLTDSSLVEPASLGLLKASL
jgi:hypothetical protein